MDGVISLDHLLIERKRVESMLAMLKGNTEPEDIETLRQAWLQPILDRLSDLRQSANFQEPISTRAIS